MPQHVCLKSHPAAFFLFVSVSRLAHYFWSTQSILSLDFKARAGGLILTYGSGDMSQLGLGYEDNMRERKFPTVIKSLKDTDVSSYCTKFIFHDP